MALFQYFYIENSPLLGLTPPIIVNIEILCILIIFTIFFLIFKKLQLKNKVHALQAHSLIYKKKKKK